MAQKRVHILSAVNAANVSKSGSTYTIKDVCGAVDNIVMNRKLYPGEQLAKGAASLEGKPAPAGHPKNDKGQAISALNGEALASAWIGSYCRNARHTGGRTLVDVVVNEAQAKAHPEGAKLVTRLDAAIDGTNSDPIHVSTGLYHDSIATNGESNGKQYDSIAINYRYDHLAILVDGVGAGTPDDGVGLFLNEAGEPERIETFTLNSEPEDKRTKGLLAKIKQLLCNGADISFDAITSALYSQMPEGCWIRDVFDKYAIWSDRDGKLWKQDYTVSSDASVAFAGQAVEVIRTVDYAPITNQQKGDKVKEQILAALNVAGIKTEGLDDVALLSAYNSVVSKPHVDALTTANSKIAGFEQAATVAANAERDTLAAELATNSSLTVDDLKALGLPRLKELKAKAAPVVVGNSGGQSGSKYANYSINDIAKETK